MEPQEQSQTIKLPPIKGTSGYEGALVAYESSPGKQTGRGMSAHHPSSIENSLMKRLYKRSPSIGRNRMPTGRQQQVDRAQLNQSLATHSYSQLLEELPLKPRLPKTNRFKLAPMERPGPLKMGALTIQEGMTLSGNYSPRARDLLEIQGGELPPLLETDIIDPMATLPLPGEKRLPAPARKKPRQLGSEKLSNAFIENFEAMKKPTPHDFIRLLQSDKRYEQRFCYCKKTSPEFYQFEVVPYAIKDPNEFMTISARGIVHYIGEEVDYLSLSEWQREARMYKQIKDIFFFKQYRQWKNFSLWKTLMRRTRIHTQRDYLRTKLLITDPELGEPLQLIRTTTFRLTRHKIIDLGCDRPMTLEQFEQRQHDVRKRLKRDVAQIENEIKEKLVESTTTSMQVFRNENRITLSQHAMPNEAALESDEDDDNNKNAFLVGDDTRKQMPYTQKATLRQQCKRLVRYIKLVDYLAIDSKLSAIENSLRKVLDYIMFDFSFGERLVIDNRIQDQPIFEVTVIADEHNPLEISFMPPLQDLNATLSTIIKKAMLVVCQAGEYLSHDEFSRYTVGSGDFTLDQLQNKKLDLFDMALQKPEFIKLRARIDQRMHETFSIIREKSRELSLYLEIYEKNMQFRAESFREAEVDQFKPTIERFISQDQMLDAFNPIIDIHTVRLNAVALKNKIKNCPSDCLMALKKLMPVLSEERLVKLRDQLKVAETRLEGKPSTVEEYVSYMRYVKQLEEQVDEFTIGFDDCKTLHQIMEEYKIRIPEGNKMKYNETYTVLSTVRQNLERAITESETSEVKWQKELASQLPVVDQKADDLLEQLQENTISDPKADVAVVVRRLAEIGMKVGDVQELSVKLQDHETFLNMEVTKFESVETLMNEFVHKEKLWNGLQGWTGLTSTWVSEPFLELNVKEITEIVEDYFVTALACKEHLDPENPMPQLFLTAIEEFRKMLPLLSHLRSEALTKRHWSEINKIVGTNINPKDDPSLTLKRLMEIKVPEKTDEIGDVTMKAEKEKQLAAKMESIRSNFNTARLPIIPYKDSKDYFAIGPGVEDSLELLEASMVELNTMLNSKYISPLLAEVEKLYKKMFILQEFIEECVTFQRRWSQIESLFTSSDMLKYVPSEVRRYSNVDSVWKSLMKSAGEQSLLSKFGNGIKENPVELFRMNNRVLEDIERGLSEWFEKKRFEFPRFFFVSNEEILFFLSGTRNLEPLQPHLVKLFPSVKMLDVARSQQDSEKQEDIVGLTSLEYEKFFFLRTVKARGVIDQWLQQVENEVQKTLKKHVKGAAEELENAEMPKDKWMSTTPVSQILLTALNVYFVRTTELVLSEPDWHENMPVWQDDHRQFIIDVKKVMYDSMNRVSVSQFYTIRSILLTATYQRDIIDELARNKVTSVTDYSWRKQIRTYLEDELVVRQGNNAIQYGYEYQGAKPRLPMVPSTERCWVGVSQALSTRFAACVVGGYGSSKTETLKDFAAFHGKYMLELPNPQQFSTYFLELVLFGMMSTNAWINIFEINNLESECLSLLGHYIGVVRNSLQTVLDLEAGHASFSKEIVLEGRHFTLTQPLGLFCTLNPEQSERHGLQHVRELPRGLSQNLRSIAMVIPDNLEMFELILTVSGFSKGRLVAQKLIQFADLLRCRLIEQEKEPTVDLSFRYLRTLIEAAALGFKSALFAKIEELMMNKDTEPDEGDTALNSRAETPSAPRIVVQEEKRRQTMLPARTITRQSLGKSPAPFFDLTNIHVDSELLSQARERLNEVKLLYQVIQVFMKEKLGEADLPHYKDVMHDVFAGCEDKGGSNTQRSTFARSAFQSYPGELSTDVTHRAPLEKFELMKKLEMVKEVMEVHGFEFDRRLAPKIINLAEMVQNSQRGIVILGPPDQGKSTLWKVAQLMVHEEEQLKMAEDNDSECARNMAKPEYRILFPNAYSISELYGYLHSPGQERTFEDAARETNYDMKMKSPQPRGQPEPAGDQTQAAQEWVEGQLGAVIRNFLKAGPGTMNWVVLDGQIRPWADPLLNLLDEPYTLFLRTGERLRLTNSSIRVIFESDNISNAPPNILAKVSILLQRPPAEPENPDEYAAADWRSVSVELIKRKLTHPAGGSGNVLLPQQAQDYIVGLCDNYIPKALTFLRKGVSHNTVPTTEFQFIRNLISLLEALIVPPMIYRAVRGNQEIETNINLKLPMEMLKKTLIKCFIFAFTWSFAGHLGHLARPKWDNFVSQEFQTNDLPKGSVFDCQLNFSQNFGDYETWQHASDVLTQLVRGEGVNSAEMIIPTKNFVAALTLTRMHMQTGHPTLLVGQRACGKSSIMRKAISEMRKVCGMRVFSTSFHTSTSPLDFQHLLQNKLERRGRALLTGPNYKPAAIVIEDMHLPTVFDHPPHGFLYNYQASHGMNEPYIRFDGRHIKHVPQLFEFMVQVFDQRGYTDRERHFHVGVQKCSFAFTGSRSSITSAKTLSKRHLRFMQVLNMPAETEESLINIFGPTIERYLNGFKQEVRDLGKAVMNGTFLVFQAIQRQLKPCPAKPTYFFTIRHLSNIFCGLQLAGVQGSNRPDKLTRLWVHEIEREIGDALSQQMDRSWLRRHLQSMVNTHFRFDWSFEELFISKQTLFGNFMKKELHISERRYEELRDLESVERVLEEYISDFNHQESGKQRLSFPMVDHVARLVAKFVRALSFSRQHLLVIGQRVLGASSTLKLASYVCKHECETFEATHPKGRQLSMKRIRPELRRILFSCGLQKKSTVLIIDEEQFKGNRELLEVVQMLMSSREVPGLLEPEDQSTIEQMLRQRTGEDPEQIYDTFRNNLGQCLHMALVMREDNSQLLRERFRIAPALYSYCRMIFLLPWPTEALHQVARKLLKNLSDKNGMDSLEKAQGIAGEQYKYALQVEESFNAQQNKTSRIVPDNFAEHVRTADALFQEMHGQFLREKEAMEKGVDAMKRAEGSFRKNMIKLERLDEVIAGKVAEQDEMIKVIESVKSEAFRQKEHIDSEVKSNNEIMIKVNGTADKAAKRKLQGQYDSNNVRIDKLRKEWQKVVENAKEQEKKLQVKMKGRESLDKDKALLTELINDSKPMQEFLRRFKVNWQKRLDVIRNNIDSLPGRCLTAAAMISYTGRFNLFYRKQAKQLFWHASNDYGYAYPPKTAEDRQFVLADAIAGTKSEYTIWRTQGLPAGDLNEDSAVMAMRSLRRPLIIDPVGLIQLWLGRARLEHDIRAVALEADNFQRELFSSIKMGFELMVTGISDGHIPAQLLPVLENRTFVGEKGKIFIRMGNETIPYNPNFRLYLFTAEMDPVLPPRFRPLLNVINFGFNRKGVETILSEFIIGVDIVEAPSQKPKELPSLGREIQELERRKAGYENDLITNLAEINPDNAYDEKSFSFIEDIKKLVLQIQDQIKQIKRSTAQEYFRRIAYIKPAREASLHYQARHFVSANDSFSSLSFSVFRERVAAMVIKFQKQFTKKNESMDMRKLTRYLRKNMFQEFTRSFNITQRLGMALYLLIHQLEAIKDNEGIQIRHNIEKMAMLGLLRNDKTIWQGTGVLEDTADSLGSRRHKQISKKNPLLAKRISWPKVSELLILERQVVDSRAEGKNKKVFDGLLASLERDLPTWLEWAKGTIFEPSEDLVGKRPRKATVLVRSDTIETESEEEGYDNFLTPEEFQELRSQMIQLPVVQRAQNFGSVVVIEDQSEAGTKQTVETEPVESKRWDEVLTDFEKLLIIKYLAPEEFKRHTLVLLDKYFKGDDGFNILESHDLLAAISQATPTVNDPLVPVVIEEKGPGQDVIDNLLRNAKGSRTPTPTTPGKGVTPPSQRRTSLGRSVTMNLEEGMGNARSFSLGHDRGLVALKGIRDMMRRPMLLILKDLEYASQYFFKELLKIINEVSQGDANERFRLVLLCRENPRSILPKDLLSRSMNVVAQDTKEFQYHFEQTMKQTDHKVWAASIEARKAAFALAFMHSVLLTRKQYSLWASSYDTITIGAYHISTALMLDFCAQEHPNSWDDLRKSVIEVAYGAVVLSEQDTKALQTFVHTFLWKNRAARGQFRFPGEIEADKLNMHIEKRQSVADVVKSAQKAMMTESKWGSVRASTQQIKSLQTQKSIKPGDRWWNQVPSQMASLDEYLEFIAGIYTSEDFSRMIGVHPSIQMAMDQRESYALIDIISIMAGNQSKVSQPSGGDVKVYNPLLMHSAKLSAVATTTSGDQSRVQSADQALNIRGETQAQDLPRVTLLERDVCVILSEFLMSMPLVMYEIDAAEGVFVRDKYLRLDPLSVFLKQEMERYNTLILKITHDCEQLRMAIAGQTAMSRYLEKLYHCFLANLVPQQWHNSHSTSHLMTWFKQFKIRAKIIYQWLTQGEPVAFYVPAFLNPKGFFNALIQQYIRKTGASSETVGVFTEVQPYRQPKEIPKHEQHMANVYFIYGLYLHNAVINMESLALQDSIEEFTECPVIMLKPSAKYALREGDYQCPVLKVPADRAHYGEDNRVFSLDLLTDVPSERWVVVGAFLVCDK